MMKRNLIIYLSGFIILFFSCSGFEKLVKSNDYKKKYEQANTYYAEAEYYRAQILYDQIASVYRGTSQADTIYFRQAMTYFHQRDYIMAGHYFQSFAKTYGGSPFVEEAEYMTAFCNYLDSPRPELDQTNTIMAIQSFQLFLIKHAQSAKKDTVIGYIKELQEKLVEKSFISAKLYYDLDDYKASLVALGNSLLDYPESDHREQIMYMILKSSYMLADNSIASKQKDRFQDTIDEYYSFKAEYPDSKYIKAADKYYDNAARFLGDELKMNEEEIDIN